jgi:lsr operon transcriptional repressor
VFDGVTLVTLTGGVDGYLRAAAGGGMNGVADQLNVMPAPLLASSPAVAATLREEAAVRAVMERAQQADVTLIGIGAVIPDASIMLMGLQTADQLRGYAAQGATGDILGELYDDRGRVLALDLHEIRIGIPIASLRDMRLVVAAAGGLVKVPAILGALRGGYVDVLVTSEDVAQALLRAPA